MGKARGTGVKRFKQRSFRLGQQRGGNHGSAEPPTSHLLEFKTSADVWLAMARRGKIVRIELHWPVPTTILRKPNSGLLCYATAGRSPSPARTQAAVSGMV